MTRWLGIVGGAVAGILLGVAAGYTQDSGTARGRQVYMDRKCSLCHSVAGKGNPKGPLDGVGSKLSAADIREWIVNPKEMAARTGATRTPAMRPYSDLPPADLDALVAYLQSLK
jgi:mono/diheme cytochrome c family protein